MKNNTRKLALFFTAGSSIKLWKRIGNFNREKLIYDKLLEKKYFHLIYWFTYGNCDKQYQKQLNNKIVIVPKPNLFYGKIGSYLYSILLPLIRRKQLIDCDVYKTNQMKGAWTAIICKWLYKKPLLVRTGFTMSISKRRDRKMFGYYFYLFIEKIVYKYADYAIVSNDTDKIYLINKNNIRNIIKLPNYVDTKLFNINNIRKTKELVYVGRLSPEKNLINLINALTGLDYSLDVYGEGNLLTNLEKKANKLAVKVTFKGNLPNEQLPDVLNQYKLFILCSYYEGMPKTLLEAMSCGLACLGTQVVGIKEVINHGYNGWLVNTSKQSIKNGIIKLMNDNNLRQNLGINARITIEREYSIDKIYSEEVKIYNKLLFK